MRVIRFQARNPLLFHDLFVSSSTPRAPLADPRRARPRSAHGHPRRDRREHRAAVRAGGARLLRREPAVDRHRLHVGLRRPAAARRPRRRPRRPQAHPRHRTRRLAIASAIGGAAQSFGVLVAARALQGAFGALLAPAALSLLTTTFTEPDERGKAFGVFGAMGVAGGAIGLLLGGALTEYISWRWCMYINIAIAIPAAVAALALLHDQARTAAPKLDAPGTVTAVLGLVALVYGFSQAETDGWGAGTTLGFIAAGLVLLTAFVALQRKVAHPLLPLRVVLDRNRGGAFIALATNSGGLMAVFLFLTYYLQQNLGMSPVETGLAFLPSPIVVALASMQLAPRLAARLGARLPIAAGMALAAVGMVLLAQLDAASAYLTGVVPGLVVMSLGLGCVMGLAMAPATFGVAPADAGVAGATVNTMQQVGGSLGTALLSTLAISAMTSRLAGAPRAPELVAAASAHGYTTAFWCSAALLAIGGVLSWALIERHRAEPATAQDAATGHPVAVH